MATLANGVTGHLICGHDGSYYFRVYDTDHNFVDYELIHSDLCVTITDPDAYFYRGDGTDLLDHSPQTLGIKGNDNEMV
jgi:hypothetical protein